MKCSPTVDVVIPCYNVEHIIKKCVNSIINQEYNNTINIYLINDDSTDNTLKILNSFSNHKNIHVINSPNNRGRAATRNEGIKFAKGEYISFLDVDDEIEPDKHNALLDELRGCPQASMAIGQTKIKYSDGRLSSTSLGPLQVGLNIPPIPGFLWLKQLQHNPCISALLVKNNMLKNSLINFPEIQYGEDNAFNVLIGLKHNIITVDKLVSTYHRHPKSSVSKAYNQISVLERYFQFYQQFALPYFSERRLMEPFTTAYDICDKIAYSMLMKLIKVESKSMYRTVLKDMQRSSLIRRSIFRSLLFSVFTYDIASYLNQKINY